LKRIFLDSSAYIKAFVDEDGTRSIKALLALADEKKVEIFLSQWAINESINAIDIRCYKKKMMTEEKRDEAIGRVLRKSLEYSKKPSSKITIVPVDRELVKFSTVFIYSDFHLSADDALHFSTAFYYDCEYLITGDSRLKRQAHNQVEISKGTERSKVIRIKVLDAANAKEMGELLRLLE
jgi:predicted nucleic acid-binding protein